MTFTVEINDHQRLDQCQVEVFLDRDALEDLVKQLGFLSESGDHAHFFTPAWGGNSLTEEVQNKGNLLVNHFKITLV